MRQSAADFVWKSSEDIARDFCELPVDRSRLFLQELHDRKVRQENLNDRIRITQNQNKGSGNMQNSEN